MEPLFITAHCATVLLNTNPGREEPTLLAAGDGTTHTTAHRHLHVHGPDTGTGSAHVSVPPGAPLHLDLHTCTVTAVPSTLGDVEVLAQTSTLTLDRVAELSVVAAGTDVTARITGRRLVARLTASGMTAHLDRPDRVWLGGAANTITLNWPQVVSGCDYRDRTSHTRIHHEGGVAP